MRSLVLAVVLSVALAAGGCAPESQEKPKVSGPPKSTVEDRLTVAAEKAAAALGTLAEIEQALQGPSSASAPTDFAVVPVELAQKVTIAPAWVGPLEPLVRRLAERADFKFQVVGLRPKTPLVVRLEATERPLVDLLRDIGLQVGGKADIVVDASPGHRVFEVRYAP